MSKLNFLQSLIPVNVSSPRHLEDNDGRVDDGSNSEASNDSEDDPAFELLFPSTLSFLDRSSLELEENAPRRLPSPLLLRREYEDISKLIKKEHPSNGNSVIVSGQPLTQLDIVSACCHQLNSNMPRAHEILVLPIQINAK